MGNNNKEVATPCSELLSEGFIKSATQAFEALGTTDFRRHSATHVTRTYYVMLELKNDIPLEMIDERRLSHFQGFLWGYLLVVKDDELAEKLWTKIDNHLSEIYNKEQK